MRRNSTLNTMPGLMAFAGMCAALIVLGIEIAKVAA